MKRESVEDFRKRQRAARRRVKNFDSTIQRLKGKIESMYKNRIADMNLAHAVYLKGWKP